MKKNLLFLFCVAALALAGCETETKSQPLLGDVHEHADFKVYLNGQAVNFAQQKYMSSKENLVNNFMHLHDMDGDVMHQHMSTTTLSDFFESLNMKFDDECFVIDNTSYCSNDNKTLKMYVNGIKNDQFGSYDFNDLDKILITYGSENESEIQQQIDSVTDKACIQSLKCPEKGTPSDESTCLSGSDCILATGMSEETSEQPEEKGE